MTARCKICLKGFDTLRGLRAHVSQTTRCRYRLCELAAQSGTPAMPAVGPMSLNLEQDQEMADLDPDDIFHPADLAPPAFHHSPAPKANHHPLPKRARTMPEQVENATDPGDKAQRWVEDFPGGMAGTPLWKDQTKFEEIRDTQKHLEQLPWAPFESVEEWELARWLMLSGLSQTKIDAFLKLAIVRTKYSHLRNDAHTVPNIDQRSCWPFICDQSSVSQEDR
jgi:hypothetical protein